MADGLDIRVRLDGFDRLVRSLNSVDVGQRTFLFLDAAGTLVRDEARIRTPVNSGLLRAQINYEVDQQSPPRWVDIGTRVHYAPYMEYGTGLVHDHPSWPKVRHIPFVNRDEKGQPVQGLFYWASRKGLGKGGAYRIAHAIAKRGGLRPRRFLRGSLEDLQGRIGQRWAEVRDGISRHIAGGGQA